MADSNSTGMVPVARSSNGTPLFANPCPACGKPRLSDRRRLGKMCQPCATSAATSTLGGLSRHPLYKLLKGIEVRCHFPSGTNYQYYGGRGIAVCDEWRSEPAAFVKWALENGYASGLEIDRIDNDGPYSPGNCQFISRLENMRKRKDSRCGVSRAKVVKDLLAQGWTIGEAAAEVGTTYMTVWHISNGDSWADV